MRARDLRLEIIAMPQCQRWPSQRMLGERLNVTCAERERLRLWGIDPYDMTEAAMALFRKRKKRQRDKLRRQFLEIFTARIIIGQNRPTPIPRQAVQMAQPKTTQ
jgi:hypothetical protein